MQPVQMTCIRKHNEFGHHITYTLNLDKRQHNNELNYQLQVHLTANDNNNNTNTKHMFMVLLSQA